MQINKTLVMSFSIKLCEWRTLINDNIVDLVPSLIK
jgi:hypothetical protein